jgi:hypothetical protein
MPNYLANLQIKKFSINVKMLNNFCQKIGKLNCTNSVFAICAYFCILANDRFILNQKFKTSAFGGGLAHEHSCNF